MRIARALVEDAQVQAQAREWFVRLLGDNVPAEDIVAWEIWLREDAAHAAAFDSLSDAWSDLGKVDLPSVSIQQFRDDSYDAATSVLRWRRRPQRMKLIWAAGAALVVAAAVGLTWMSHSPAVRMDSRRIVTARAEKKQETLADGSIVLVGARSRVEVAFNQKRRALSLVSGEALFRVAHEPARPFVVSTPLGSVTAVGTAFDVDVGSSRVVLKVSEGVVSVETALLHMGAPGQGDPPIRVSAGQTLVLDVDGVHLVRLQPNDAFGASWTAGLMAYHDTPLRAVLEDVNRYAEKRIVLADASLGDLAYTGAVQLDDTLDWARGLRGAFPIIADTSDASRILLRRKISTGRAQ